MSNSSDILNQQPPTNPDELKAYRKALKIKEKQLLNEEIANHSKPFALATFFVERPFITLLINIVIFIVCAALTFGLNAFEMAEQTDREYLIWSDERVIDFDMQRLIEEAFQEDQSADQELPERSQENIDWNTNAIVRCKNCDNVLTAEGIKTIIDVEKTITDLKNYENVCLASQTSSECSNTAIYSINSIVESLNLDYKNLSDNDVELIIDQIFNNFDSYKFLFSSDLDENSRKASFFRAIFNFGVPLKIDGKLYENKYDNQNKQDDYFEDFSQNIIDTMEKYQEEDLPNKYELYVYSSVIDQLSFTETVDSDSLWAIASVAFVYAYLTFHVKSFLISTFAIISILVSFPLTQVIYNLIFQISYFSSLHIMAVFVILGIAADDLFVLVDAWNQTRYYDQINQDLKKRMALTFRRAAYAMLATSSTTSAAFFATGLSDIMPISAFGIYAGILVPMNYILTIFFMPCILIINEKMQCCKRKQKQEQEKIGENNNKQPEEQNNIKDSEKQLKYQNKKEEDMNRISPSRENIIAKQQNQNQEDNYNEDDSKSDIEDIPEQKLPPVEKFFAHYFNNFIIKIRYVVIIVIVIWLGISIWQSTKISPLTEPEKFLSDDHPIEISKDLLLEGFHQSALSTSGIKVYQYWGADSINKDGVSMWDAENLGEIVWDDNFDLSPKQNQQWFYDYCDQLQYYDLVQDNLVESFIFTFKDYAETNYGAFPVEQVDFLDQLKNYVENDIDGQAFFSTDNIGIIGGELKYIQIKIASTGTPFRPYKETYPLWEKWNKLVEEGNSDAPKGMKNSNFTALYHFTWMISEKAFSDNAIQGMLIAILFAFAVLLFSTKNIIIALYSIFSIIGIVLSVVCIMQFAEWQLGVAESIALVVLIGMSVDYVVHLANHYVESIYPDRHNKIMVSLRDLGISIISSAVTTIGSGIFLLFAELVIFNKFAILIICTIIFSLVFSLFFFAALCHIMGPQKQQGNLLALIQKCRKNKKQETIRNNSTDNINNNDIQIIKSEKQLQNAKQEQQTPIQQIYNENAIIQEQNSQQSGELQMKYIDEEAFGYKDSQAYKSVNYQKK